MLVLLAGAWVLFVVVVLAMCRAAARADEQDERAAARRLARVRTVGLVTATTAVAAQLHTADAEAAACAARAGSAPADVAGMIACRIDSVRARSHLRRVHDDAALTHVARAYAQNMAANDFFSHVSPAGGRLRDRILRAGWVTESCGWHVGEALAWGSGENASSGWVVSAWMHSPEHRRILTGRDYNEIGVGVARGAPVPMQTPAITAVALLGRHKCP